MTNDDLLIPMIEKINALERRLAEMESRERAVGNMLKSVYDANNNGIVDAAESVPWAGVTDKPEIDAANINWASDATIVGWSSRTSTFIRYASIGPMVFVSFYITGTSNSTNTSFTLPFNVTGMTIRPLCRIRDNDNYALGSVYLFGDTATFFPTVSGGNWTASGTKEIAGEFFYWKA